MKARRRRPVVAVGGLQATSLGLMPRAVTVLGHDFPVDVVDGPSDALMRDDGNDHALGQTDLHRDLIRLRGGGEQSAMCAKDTLLHEVLHAATYLAGIDLADDNESFVRRLSPVLLLVLRENPTLVKALTA